MAIVHCLRQGFVHGSVSDVRLDGVSIGDRCFCADEEAGIAYCYIPKAQDGREQIPERAMMGAISPTEAAFVFEVLQGRVEIVT